MGVIFDLICLLVGIEDVFDIIVDLEVVLVGGKIYVNYNW